jgi:hypothetical protein
MRRSVPRARSALLLSLVLLGGLLAGAGPARAADDPPGIDPGDPPYTGLTDPVPGEPAPFDPAKNTLQAIFDADVAAGGTSYWFDRILARPFLNNTDSTLFTRGRALYMYTHAPGTLGFGAGGTGANGGGGYAYRQPPTTGTPRSLYTLGVSGGTLTENTAQRVQYPSHYAAGFSRSGLSVAEKKFVTFNNVAVTELTLTNTGDSATITTVTANSPIATTPSADGSELTGTVTLRYGLSTIFPRMSGDGFTAGESSLTKDVSLEPGASATVKVQLGTIANELPESAAEYQRYRGYDPQTAWLTQMREYNKWFVDNVPYVDIPDANVKKMSFYRTWLNRFNTFDGNIPGNDYQFPVDLEGALGYNNQISLTVPMRLQDLQYWRDPLQSYGPWLSMGEESGCQSFHDNPGNTGNWNNTYEQWTAAQAWQSYLVHGGPKPVVDKLAKYAECDVKGTLAKFDTNKNNLIEYSSGTLPGNDADSVAFKYYGTRPQDRTESSFWYAGAQAAAAEYDLLGDKDKAKEMSAIAGDIKSAVLNTLWAGGQVTNAPESSGNATGPRVTGKIGNAVKLSGQSEYANLPTGIVSGLTGDFTISAWVNPGATTTWSRIFDFGTGTTANMFLTINAGGGGPRFAITTGGGGAEQQVNSSTGQLPLNTWSHVAVTLSGNTATMYVNGTPVGTNPNVTLRPSNLGNTNQNWIGRSQYGDPYLNSTVDDFHIYNSALSSSDVQALAGGQQGAGNVAAYRFDEAGGATATDSSGNGRDATIVSLTKPTITCPGKVFLQKDLTTGNQVCWKDQQNFAPFIDGIAPNTDEYKQALRYYADPGEFPIMPSYTANQADQAADQACEACLHGSNNFSNINATLQARLFAKALREYPSPYITPHMQRRMIEWLAWTQYIGGDNRFPDNNEFFFNWNPRTKTFGRSGIHHDVLGSFNWLMFEDVAGMRPRQDDVAELWPIDMNYDHFAVGNLSYHGSDVSIVWQRPGGTLYYPSAPFGYSLYVDGKRAFTADRLAHLRWDSRSGRARVLDGGGAKIVFNAQKHLRTADEVDLRGNARIVDGFQRAGLDLAPAQNSTKNLALGKAATASFTTTTPAAQATKPENAVDGYTISGLPVVSGSYVGTNPIWGDLGSPNAQDWWQVDLGDDKRFDHVRLYFYSNKAFGSGGNTYREPASYTIQYWGGSSWEDVPGQVKNPASPAANYNDVTFWPVTARQVRVLMDRVPGFAVGLKEVQVLSR